VALQGTLDTFALSDVLRLLAATKKTGRLRITGGRGTGSVWASSGEIVGVEATHAPHATSAVDALFELLRFTEGAFTFDAEAQHDNPSPATDVEILLVQAESLLEEWRSIESVVPSLDAWVTLRPALGSAEVTIDQARWTTLVAVGGGATVRRIADELCLAELPVSRAVKELVETGLVDIAAAPPAGAVPQAPLLSGGSPAPAPRPLVADKDDEAPAPRTLRARRARSSAPAEPEVFVPLDLPGTGPAASYDPPVPEDEPAEDGSDADAADDLAAAFPGLANHSTPSTVDVDDEELAKQLATLSPRAASAIRAAAEAETDEEREAALDAVDDDEDQPLNRGLLLKFLSSVKS
jgi:hypothetical protein